MKNWLKDFNHLEPILNTSKLNLFLKKYTPYLVVIFSALIITLGFFVVYKKYFSSKVVNLVSEQQVPTATPTPDPDRPISILLLGYGGGSHDGGSLTDSIILSQIRPHDNKIILISIPRDLWVNNAKINYAFPSGGGDLSKKLISEITGVNIDYFLAIDFNGFIKVVDLLGGINLKVTKPFVDNYYPLDIGTTDNCGKTPQDIIALEATMSGDKLDQQFTCRYETLKFDIGTTHIDGLTALKFARSRHSETNGGDFNRGERQRQVILAIRDKVISLNFFTKIIPIIKTLSYHLHTDIQISDIEKYLLRANEFSQYKVESYSINDKNVLMQSKSTGGQAILIPTSGIDKFEDIKSFVASISAKPTNSP